MMMFTQKYFDKVTRWQVERQRNFRSIPLSGIKVNYLGKQFLVFKNVFIPFIDTEPLIKHFRINKGESVLDIGTGCGLIAIFAAYKRTEKIIAVDINPDAVKTAKVNVQLHGFSDIIEIRQSDVFSQIKKGEKFDVITANLPLRNKQAKNIIEASMWDTNLQAHKKLLHGAKVHLKKTGCIYLSQSNFGAVKEVIKLSQKENFKVKVIGQKHKSRDEIFYALQIERI